MLRLLNIEFVDEDAEKRTYRVTLDRDGVVRHYEFTWHPSRPSEPGMMDHPANVHYECQITADLLDYEWFPPPGTPHGALVIPPLSEIIQCVYKVARGKSFDFPLILDER